MAEPCGAGISAELPCVHLSIYSPALLSRKSLCNLSSTGLDQLDYLLKSQPFRNEGLDPRRPRGCSDWKSHS